MGRAGWRVIETKIMASIITQPPETTTTYVHAFLVWSGRVLTSRGQGNTGGPRTQGIKTPHANQSQDERWPTHPPEEGVAPRQDSASALPWCRARAAVARVFFFI